MITEKQLEANRQKTKRGKVKTKSNKAIIKKSEDTTIKKMTIKETKDFINKVACFDCDPKRIMEELSEDLLPQMKAGKANKEIQEKTAKVILKALMTYGLDTHYPLAETVGEIYRPLVIEFSRQLIQEYKCQTPSEKALAEIIVSAYSRIIEYSNKLNNCIAQEWLMDDRLNYFSRLSKEIDRANRQFTTALTTLKQLKEPSLTVNVKTKAAFVAQNQQLNVNTTKKETDLDKNENIKPK